MEHKATKIVLSGIRARILIEGSSVVDPDPVRILIRIQEGKNDPQKIEKVNKFHFLKR